jgi:tRNA pseudouridine32 synthase/23S rRNA pseudouridine746 synthase
LPELFDARWLVHADSELLVLEKPSGLLCQPGLGDDLSDSLITRVLGIWPEARLVHRLDRDTSGLILMALNAPCHRALSQLFAERRVQKRYEADVQGVPKGAEGEIALPIAKRQHRPPLYGVDPAGKASLTTWRLLRQSGGCSRLELEPRTGRSHQLRVHLEAIGHPIVGDPLYGQVADRLHLHAAALGFRHPGNGQELMFQRPCPFDLPTP